MSDATCERCGGSGKVLRHPNRYQPDLASGELAECPYCYGTGKVNGVDGPMPHEQLQACADLDIKFGAANNALLKQAATELLKLRERCKFLDGKANQFADMHVKSMARLVLADALAAAVKERRRLAGITCSCWCDGGAYEEAHRLEGIELAAYRKSEATNAQ